MGRRTGLTLLVIANLLIYGVLSLNRTSDAAPPKTGGQPPFANAVEQRMVVESRISRIERVPKQDGPIVAMRGNGHVQRRMRPEDETGCHAKLFPLRAVRGNRRRPKYELARSWTFPRCCLQRVWRPGLRIFLHARCGFQACPTAGRPRVGR